MDCILKPALLLFLLSSEKVFLNLILDLGTRYPERCRLTRANMQT